MSIFNRGEKKYVTEISSIFLIGFILASIADYVLFPYSNLIGMVLSIIAIIMNAPKSGFIDDGDDMGLKPNK